MGRVNCVTASSWWGISSVRSKVEQVSRSSIRPSRRPFCRIGVLRRCWSSWPWRMSQSPATYRRFLRAHFPPRRNLWPNFSIFQQKVLFFRWDTTCMPVATCLGSAVWSQRDRAASILKSAIMMELIVWGVYFKDWVNNDSQREDHIVLFVHLSVYENIFIFQQPLFIGLKFPLIGRFCLHIHSSIHRLKARSAALEMFQKGKLAKIQAQMFQMENR